MATDLRRRVTNLERGQGPAGPWCACAGDIVTIWHADGEPAGTIGRALEERERERARDRQGKRTDLCETFAQVDAGRTTDKVGAPCETCGKPVRVITLVWDDGGLEDRER